MYQCLKELSTVTCSPAVQSHLIPSLFPILMLTTLFLRRHVMPVERNNIWLTANKQMQNPTKYNQPIAMTNWMFRFMLRFQNNWIHKHEPRYDVNQMPTWKWSYLKKALNLPDGTGPETLFVLIARTSFCAVLTATLLICYTLTK